MKKIRIVDVPPGDAPEWVRKEWVGLELPVATAAPEDSLQIGVLGGEPQNLGGYPVESKIAVEILSKKSPEAAQWWKENFSFTLMPWLVFKKEVCKVICEKE